MRSKTATNVGTAVLGSLGVLALVGGTMWACGAGDTAGGVGGAGNTTVVGGGGAGATGAGGTGGATGGFNPTLNPCMGKDAEIICDKDVAITCENEVAVDETDCGDEICVPGIGCQLCIDGQFSCYGNQLRSCNVGPPLHWDLVTTCNPNAAERCNPTTGVCEVLTPIGNGPSDPTGTYYQYAYFHVDSSVFEGGCDVDSYGNYLYVNHGNWYEDGTILDVYVVELLDSDGDTEFEPNQHPDNPDDTGPIEDRVLTKVGTYSIPELGMVHHAEVYALDDRVYVLNAPDAPGNLYEYMFGAGSASPYISNPDPIVTIAQSGFDDVSGIWYGSSEAARRVYSYHEPTNAWVAEFAYPDLAGSHMDGMEVVTDPNTGTAYVYVSDMTSDFLGQYKRERGGTWVQVNLFQYEEVTGKPVEGMGFGAFNHFWITSGGVTQSGALYEIGGGDLQKFTEPWIPPN